MLARSPMCRHAPLLLTALLIFTGSVSALDFTGFTLPPGFRIALYADGVPDARQMSLSPGGVLYVGSRAGEVYAVVDRDGDYHADEVTVIARGLNLPAGVSYHDGDLYVAEVNRIIRFEAIDGQLAKPPPPTVVNDSLPTDRHHGWKYLDFGPDGWLYVPVGAPCNVCLRDAPYASMLRMRADGTGLETYAEGIRNSVGFAWQPDTHDLWFTDNGRDWLGDDEPSCELNRATARGQHFGFPFVHAGDIPDPEFGTANPGRPFTAPMVKLGPHVAPLGLIFYTDQQFPAEYRHSMLIAEHGSWNRSKKIGYRIVRVQLGDGGAVIAHEPFVSGWLQHGRVYGRPVDLEQLPDGSVLVSDDENGAIYRISYQAP